MRSLALAGVVVNFRGFFLVAAGMANHGRRAVNGHACRHTGHSGNTHGFGRGVGAHVREGGDDGCPAPFGRTEGFRLGV